jgi:transcriptional regulator with XRE-family HTH domain
MKLSEYLAAHDLTDPAFAALVGCDRTTVLRWRSAKVMPEREQMRRIAEVTEGAVTANDFYDIEPAAPEQGAAA